MNWDKPEPEASRSFRSDFWLLHKLPIGIFVLNQEFTVLFWNKVMREWSGISEDNIIGKNLLKMFPETSKPKFIKRVQTIFQGGPPAIFSSHLHGYFLHLKTSSGQTRLQNTTVTALKTDADYGYNALFTVQDVTELNTRIVEYRKIKDQVLDELNKRKNIENRLRREKRFISLLLDTVRVLIILLDREGRIKLFNRACEELTGYDSREIEDRCLVDLLLPEEEKEKIMVFFQNQMIRMPEEFENCWVARDGDKRLISWSNSLVYDEQGQPEYVLGTGIDITEQRKMEKQIKHMAMHDELTGLANRNLLQERLSRSIALADRYGKKLAILFLDLDGFKTINDSYGHNAGDMLLKEVARRIETSTRASDTVARYGGDEFVVVLPEIDDYHDAISVSRKISKELSRTYELGDHHCTLGVSIGISIYPDDGHDSASVLQLADRAMYRAKSQGNNNYCYMPLDEQSGTD
ncbi:MAG: diguanylate cyclase domain-containing protein [Desulfonatronovibrionaceae bacterium]